MRFYILTLRGIKKLSKWVSLGEFKSYELTKAQEEYQRIMKQIPNFDKRKPKKKSSKK